MNAINSLENKIPPPLITVFFALLMWLVSLVTYRFTFAEDLRIILSLLFFLAGFTVAFLGIYSFIKFNTTVSPIKLKEVSNLVTTGVYKYSRNPMYLGLFIILVGWGILLSNLYTIVFPFVFILTINRLQIIPEERVLESIFRSKYVEYKSRVSRWI
ncbi:MAG TPA: protein-S-isoprenylcysteine methyltransferase [Gammaproteobacteria bacterium]|nr:isoprenylcysteine carboxylmethyltransferase family protein [Gammaproteobacteria bacterium]HAY41548.1 protein-S-isoprenylcysteine methyltransferase [Gammaproteobacteria bacterium]